MIVWYFCRRFLTAFLLILVMITGILSGVNVVGKNIFSSPELLVALFVGSVPLMAVFVYPLALMCAHLIVLYDAQEKGEVVLINFFTRLRFKLLSSAFWNAFLLTICFIPLIFFIAPRSYDWGKQLLYAVMEQKLNTLSPGLLHFPLPGIAVYFEESHQHGSNTELRNFFLVQQAIKKEPPYPSIVLWGEKVLLNEHYLVLCPGVLIGFNKQDGEIQFASAFERGVLDLEKVFISNKKKLELSPKYKTITELWKSGEPEALLESYKRYYQIIWVFLSPLAAYWVGVSRYRRTVPGILGISCCWFFMLYGLLLSVSAVFSYMGREGLYLLFLLPILVTFCLYINFRKNFF